MSRMPWTKFFHGDWRSDVQLARCGAVARGVWIEVIAAMAEQATYQLEGDPDEVARVLRLTPSEVLSGVRELGEKGVADVWFDSDKLRTNRGRCHAPSESVPSLVRIVSRRRSREVEKLEKDRLRKRMERLREKEAESVQPLSAPTSKKNPGESQNPESRSQKSEDRKREKGEAPFDPLSLDLPFRSTEFLRAWKLWVDHRREIRHKLTPSNAETLLAKFSRWGEKRAIRAIEHTVAMGWRGIREPEPQEDQAELTRNFSREAP